MEKFYETIPVELAYDLFNPPSNVHNRKPPIILMHGLFMNRKTLREVAELMSVNCKRKVFIPDLRCHGDSPYEEPVNVFVMAADIKKFIQNFNLRKICFVCNSFSSRIGTIVAFDQPQIVEKIVFVEISPFCEDTHRFQLTSKLLHGMRNVVKMVHSSEMTEEAGTKGIIALYTQKDTAVKVLDSLTVSDREGFRHNSDFYQIEKAFLDGSIALHPLGVYSGQVLFFYGSESTPSLRDDSDESLEKYFPNHKKICINGAGHGLVYEKPKEFVEEIRKFLED